MSLLTPESLAVSWWLAEPTGGDPPVQMRALLKRAKPERIPFDTAWDIAMDVIRWPASQRDAKSWRDMLNATREGWRATYDDMPQLPHERALSQVAEVFERIAAA